MSSTKRLKHGHDKSSISGLGGLPDMLLLGIVSFSVDFGTLLSMRATNRRLKRFSEQELRKRAFDSFPIDDIDLEDHSWYHWEVSFELNNSWSTKFRSDKAVVEHTLRSFESTKEDHEGSLFDNEKEETDYDEVQARNLLHLKGSFEAKDFKGAENVHDGYFDDGWGAEYCFLPIDSMGGALCIAESLFAMFRFPLPFTGEDFPGSQRLDSSDFPNVMSMKLNLFSLFLGATEFRLARSSVFYTGEERDETEEAAICFLSGDQKIEFVVRSHTNSQM